MLSLQGNTAVYLLYAHARIAAIGRKAGIDNIAALAHEHAVELDHERERALAMHVSDSPLPPQALGACIMSTMISSKRAEIVVTALLLWLWLRMRVPSPVLHASACFCRAHNNILTGLLCMH